MPAPRGVTMALDPGKLSRDGLDKEARREREEKARKAELRGISPDNLLDFGNAETTRIGFLDGLPFPGSGAVILGARTAGGKSTAQINLCREYLQQGKSVDFVSYELDAAEVVLLLALSLYAHGKTEPIPGWTRKDPGPGRRIYDLDELERSLPPLAEDDDPDFMDLPSRVKTYVAEHGEPPAPLKAAYADIREFMAAGRLRVSNGLGNIEHLAEHIRATDYTAYIIDYLQVIPAVEPFGTYRDVQSVCNEIRALVNQDRKLLILAAQFNRTAGDESTRDSFDPRPDQFREAGDVEQVATLAIGIGYQTDEEGRKHFFYKILKNRFAGRMAGAKLVSAGYFDLCYAVRGGRWTLPEKWPKPARKLGGAQEIIVKILRGAGGSLSPEDLSKAFVASGKRKDHFRQTVDPLLEKGKVKLGENGKYHLID